MKAALQEDPPPTAGQLASRLGFAGQEVLARNFPTLYAALLERRNVYEKAKRKQLHSALISALSENPAPTVPAVCERLGISTSWVYCQHRDLARAIAARHLRQRAESMEQRRDLESAAEARQEQGVFDANTDLGAGHEHHDGGQQ